MNRSLSHITTRELVHDYLESYMDIARCELALLYPNNAKNSRAGIQHRLDVNKSIVSTVVYELHARDDTSLFDERELILREFTT